MELYLRPTNLHVHGVMLKLRVNVWFLNSNMKGNETFLGGLAKLRKATVSFFMSVCSSVHPSIPMKQIVSHWKEFHEIQYFGIFRKSVAKSSSFIKI